MASPHPRDWTLVQKGRDVFLLAETVHAPGANRGADLPAFHRYRRNPFRQDSLFNANSDNDP